MDKWYEYYYNKVEEVRKRNPNWIIMTKEKYWRFDISAYDLDTKFDYDYLSYLEDESLDRCMDCAKIRKQYETWLWWWMRHYCLPCLIKKELRFFWWKIKLLFANPFKKWN